MTKTTSKKSAKTSARKGVGRALSAKTNAQSISAWGKIWRIALCIAVPLGGGLLISLLTGDAMSKFGSFNQPPLAPPAWLFPVAWTILYVLMGLASYLIWAKSKKGTNKEILILYGLQLAMNFVWTPLFFLAEQYWFAFAWLVAMWIVIIMMMVKTKKVSVAALLLLVPYILWCTFAAYLNCGIAILN